VNINDRFRPRLECTSRGKALTCIHLDRILTPNSVAAAGAAGDNQAGAVRLSADARVDIASIGGLRLDGRREKSMNGAVRSPWLIPALVAASVVFHVALGWVILKGYRWLRRVAESSERRVFEGLKIHDGRGPGLVAVVFHTYWGMIAFVDQHEHRFWAPPDDAREALGRLHRFDMIWGFFVHAALLIPIVSFGNYLAQKRSISKQETAMLA